MGSRMDRYKSNDINNITRSSKNKNLYTSLDNTARYTTITDVRNSNAIVLTEEEKKVKTRESYHKTKDFEELDLVEYKPIKKELDDFNYLYRDRENRVYDINTAIEEAKKNRPQAEKDVNLKLENAKYFLTKEEIEKYRKIKNKEIPPDKEKESVKELINTITSKTLRGELDQKTSVDLLSDLMATDNDDRIESQKQESNTEIVDEKLLQKVQEQKDNYKTLTNEKALLKDMDQSFYTRSMDLSDKDFELDNDFKEEKKVPFILKFFLFLLLLVLISILIYFIVQTF